jgi:hypothetical protein
MGTYIDGLHYTDDELTTGPDGKPTPKRRKVLGVAATPAVILQAPGPSEDRETASEPTYQTKVITPAAPAAPAIETKGAGNDAGSGKDSGGQASSSPTAPSTGPRR